MEKNKIISAKEIRKTFRVPHEKTTSLKQAALGLFKEKSYSNFEVLKGISFDVCEGEFFGIIGRNGCGKSTLLKILAGIYTIDSGQLEIKGSISPFLELGVGFNPELTGRENVFLNGAILGLSKKEIAEKYDEIVEFSELSEFMDQKLKNYSSGMQVRLAFSVAIHAHAPILLLDEVLAVGDASFQRKCQKVFLKLKEEKRTIVFVTHDMNAVKEYCDRAILISNGKIVAVGSPDKVANEYLIQNGESEGTEVKNINNEFVLREVLINGKKGSATIPYGTNLEVQIKVTDKGRAKKANVHLAVLNEEDQPMMTATSTDQKEYTLEKETIIKVLVSEDFAPGNYHLALSLHDTKKGESYYGNTNIGQFKITSLGEKNSNESTVSWN